MNISPIIFVRSIAYQAMEISGIKPGSVFDVQNSYNLYADPEINKRFHENLITQACEEALAAALRAGHVLPFYDLANEQNEQLAIGHIAGWCAAALQSGAAAFEEMQAKSSAQTESRVRKEMESQRESVKWESLLVLGEKIMTQRREGKPVTLENIPVMMHKIEGFGNLLKSIEKTLEDPGRGRAGHHLVKKAGL